MYIYIYPTIPKSILRMSLAEKTISREVRIVFRRYLRITLALASFIFFHAGLRKH